MDTASPSAANAPPKPYTKPYGWDRTPYSPDELADIRESYVPNIPAPEDFTFKDLLNVFNPLQQLPIVSQIYRAATGEKIHPLSRALGGALFGGPLGLIGAIANNVIEQKSGKDIGDHIASAILPGRDPAPAETDGTRQMAKAAGRKASLGERLAAVYLPDDASAPGSSMIAQGRKESIGQRLAAAALRDDDASAPAPAAVAQRSADRLGSRLAAVALPDRALAAPAAATGDAGRLAAIAPAAGPSPALGARAAKSLDDYRARAIEAPSTAAIGRASAQIQPAAPRLAQAAVAAAAPTPAPTVPAAPAPAPAAVENVTAGRLTDAPVNTWFAERMLTGLDLYRNSKRSTAKAEIDRYE